MFGDDDSAPSDRTRQSLKENTPTHPSSVLQSNHGINECQLERSFTLPGDNIVVQAEDMEPENDRLLFKIRPTPIMAESKATSKRRRQKAKVITSTPIKK